MIDGTLSDELHSPFLYRPSPITPFVVQAVMLLVKNLVYIH